MSAWFLRDVLGLGPIGVVLLSAPLVAALASVVALASRGAAGRVACASAVGVLLVCAVSTWAAVVGSRARFVREAMSAGPDWEARMSLGRAMVAEHAGASSALPSTAHRAFRRELRSTAASRRVASTPRTARAGPHDEDAASSR